MGISFGYRARVGLIYQGLIDSEFSLFLPKGVTVHIARFINDVEESKMFEEGQWAIEEGCDLFLNSAVRQLTFIEVNSIAFGCTSGTFSRGVKFDMEIIQKIEEISGGIPATTASSAVADALDTLGLRKIAVGTPYSKNLNVKLRKFLEDMGFDVVNMKSIQLLSPLARDNPSGPLAAGWNISRQSQEAVYQLAMDVDKSEADGVFLSCTSLRTAEILKELEEDLGKPVISSNQALMWKLRKLSGIRTPVEDYGKLLACR